MDLKELFRLKYELLEKLEADEVVKENDRESFRKGYEAAVNAFFIEAMARILEPETKKKAS